MGSPVLDVVRHAGEEVQWVVEAGVGVGDICGNWQP